MDQFVCTCTTRLTSLSNTRANTHVPVDQYPKQAGCYGYSNPHMDGPLGIKINYIVCVCTQCTSYTMYAIYSIHCVSAELVEVLIYSGNLLIRTTRDQQNQFLLSDVLLIRIAYYMYTTTANQIMLEIRFML